MCYNHNVLNTLCNIGDRNIKGGARLTVMYLYIATDLGY